MNTFIKRTTSPRKNNSYYYQNNIFYQSGYGMPNCTAYAWGRWYEIMKKRPKLPTSNAENWYQDTQYEKGSIPKLGAIICWKQGHIHQNQDGAGHVAIVEEIKCDGSIITSNSAYKGSNFYLKTLKPPYLMKGYTLEGFIYLPISLETINVIYQVYDNVIKKWLPSITNYNLENTNGYAGIFGHSIGGIRIKLSNNEKIEIRAHIKNKSWLAWVKKWDNTSDGYAGIKGKEIDGIQIKSTNKNIYYRIHLKNKHWLAWVNKVDNTINGYAGIYGNSIDALQVYIR